MRARDRTTQGRGRLVLGLRAANHAHLALRAVGRDRRSRAWLVAAVVSIAGDALLARRLDDPGQIPGWGQWLLEWADAAVWAHATGDRSDLVAFQTGVATPSAVLTAVDAFAGKDAVPLYNPARPYPPRGAGDARARAARMAATALVPAALAAVVRRRRGLPAGVESLAWPLSGAALAAFGTRHRDRLHRGERARWARRTAGQVRQEHEAALAAVATGSSPGHDFKKTLFALGLYGSAEAAAEARQQAQHPGELLAGMDGYTLFELTQSPAIVPAEAATLWVTPAQAEAIGAFLLRAEEQAADGADQSLRVDHVPGRRLVLEHLGQTLALDKEPPPLRARLYPSSMTLAVGAFQAFDTALMGELPLAAALPSTILLSAAAYHFFDHAPTDDELGRLLVVTAVGAALGFAAVARFGRTDRYTAFPATPFAKGALVVLAAHWGRLSPSQRLMLPAVLGGWMAVSWTGGRRTPLEMLSSLVDVAQAVVAPWRLSDLVDAEADHLERVLQDEFSEACRSGARDATVDELDRYHRQLAIARAALAAPERLDRLDADMARRLAEDCTELEEWLGVRYGELAVGAPGTRGR